MGLYRPHNLRDAVIPMILAAWFVGAGIVEYPTGHPRPIFTFFYIFCLVGAYMGSFISSLSGINELPTKVRVELYGNMMIVIVAISSGYSRSKRSKEALRDLMAIDETLKRLGISEDYRSLFLKQLLQYIVIFVILAIIGVVDFIYIVSANEPNINLRPLPMWISIHYPIIIILIVDITYFNMNLTVEKKIRRLNSLLTGLQTRYTREFVRMLYPMDDRYTNSMKSTKIVVDRLSDIDEKLYRLQLIRGLHRNLCRIARRISSVYGIHNLLSAAMTLIIAILQLYEIYRMAMETVLVKETYIILIARCCWVSLHIGKLILVVHSSSALVAEACKTGPILLQFHEPNSKFRKEVREFILQLIQTPLRLTACGFYSMDYTVLQRTAGTLVSYLVILIQMNNVNSS